MCKLFQATIALTFLLASSSLYAASGELDTGFGTNGSVVTTYSDLFPVGSTGSSYSKSVIYLSDGKIVVGGGLNVLIDTDLSSFFTLTRFNSDGTPDATFGNNGRVLTDFSANYQNVDTLVVVQNATQRRPDGYYVTVGVALVDEGADTFLDYAVAVYDADGNPDTSFNPSGAEPGTLTFRLVTSAGFPLSGATDVAIQNDNKLVISGIGGNSTVLFDFTTLRLNTDGSFDTSFNALGSTPGVSNVNFGTSASADVALSILYNPNNDQIITGGTALVAIPDSLDFAMAGYNADGTLNSSFGTSGLVLLNIGGGTSATQVNAMGMQSNGNIISAGSHNTGFYVAQQNSTTGALVDSFGTNGVFFTDLLIGQNTTVQDSGDLTIATDDKIFVTSINGGDFAFIKVLANGSGLDTTFNATGTNPGFVSTSFGASSTDVSSGITLQADGKILVTGTSNAREGNNQLLARYLGNTADVSIVKSVSTIPIINSPFDFTLTVSNAGPDTAEGVVVTDPLPSGLNFNSVTSSQGSCTGTSTIVCSLGDIALNGSATITLSVTATEGNIFTNTATVTAQVVDPNSNNNSSTVTVDVLIAEGGGGCSLTQSDKNTFFTQTTLLLFTFFSLYLTRKMKKTAS